VHGFVVCISSTLKRTVLRVQYTYKHTTTTVVKTCTLPPRPRPGCGTSTTLPSFLSFQIFYVTLLAHRAVEASEKPRIMLRRLRFGMTVLLSSVAPVNGEVSLVRSHSEMAARS